MKSILLLSIIGLAGVTLSGQTPAPSDQAQVPTAVPPPVDSGLSGESKHDTKPQSENEVQAQHLLDEARDKIQAIPSLVVDIEQPSRCYLDPSKDFEKTGVITMEHPNRFRIEKMIGTLEPTAKLEAVCDGETVTRLDDKNYVGYQKPVRAGAFFFGQSFIVQYFFNPKSISFDPTNPIWGQSVSLFDKNYAAYDRNTKVKYLGKRTLENVEYEVVEIRYSNPQTDIRQQIYIGADRLVAQVDTNYGPQTYFEKFRNYRTKFLTIGPSTFHMQKPDKMPLVSTDPVMLGQKAPEFKLPGAKGEPEISLKEILAKSKGLLVCSLSASEARSSSADFWLQEMMLIQDLKNKFESQGLQVAAIFGDATLTPDLKQELLLNWTPDLSRFNYPIAIDIDVERGIQGSAYENFQLNGRHVVLLDKDGKVVFASNHFTQSDKSSLLALYQALAQIGFTVSQADFDSVAH